MQHLTEEQLVEHYFHDGDTPATVQEHLRRCPACASSFEGIQRVLALVREAPVPDRGPGYSDQVWNRLRWKMGARRRAWRSWIAAAAILAVGFFGGLLWRAKRTEPATAPQVIAVQSRERVLLFVVNDHLETSGRVLLEIANADPDTTLEREPKKADDLVAANRLYRQTAARHGDEKIAALLADLEPVLIELSHAGATLEGQQLRDLQRRIESRNLLFKVRVVSAPRTNTL